ncbi:MAG: hypothetical protein ABL974_01630 [Prosthecobacter sp.]
MFESLSQSQRSLIYQGLLKLVTTNSGVGFANNDQGHLAYAVGRSGKSDYEVLGDSPERNKLFQMMHSLTTQLSVAELDSSSEITDYVFAWCDFCNLAYTAYENSQKQA